MHGGHGRAERRADRTEPGGARCAGLGARGVAVAMLADLTDGSDEVAGS